MSQAKAIQARFEGPEVAQIESWRRKQESIPPLAEALRTLVKRGLASESDQQRGAA
jgi:hypothetical protein